MVIHAKRGGKIMCSVGFQTKTQNKRTSANQKQCVAERISAVAKLVPEDACQCIIEPSELTETSTDLVVLIAVGLHLGIRQ